MAQEVYLIPKTPLTFTSTKRAHSFPKGNMSTRDVVRVLNVEANPRYKPTATQTFCNIAAHDFATLRGYYLPRVWWTDEALKEKNLKPKYGDTLREMSANSLYEWFEEFGPDFGWRKVDLDTAQRTANAGGMAVIVGRRADRSRSGHITVVIPSLDRNSVPLQWQAGRTNKERFRSEWYEKSTYDAWSAWAIQ